MVTSGRNCGTSSATAEGTETSHTIASGARLSRCKIASTPLEAAMMTLASRAREGSVVASHRPQDLGAIVGQEKIVETLRLAISSTPIIESTPARNAMSRNITASSPHRPSTKLTK